MYEILQGETISMTYVVIDKDGLDKDLTGGASRLAYLKPNGDVVTKDGVITDNTVKYSFTSEETSDMYGEYNIEVKMKDVLGEVDATVIDILKVDKSMMPDF